jgi:hypothetical protein
VQPGDGHRVRSGGFSKAHEANSLAWRPAQCAEYSGPEPLRVRHSCRVWCSATTEMGQIERFRPPRLKGRFRIRKRPVKPYRRQRQLLHPPTSAQQSHPRCALYHVHRPMAFAEVP